MKKFCSFVLIALLAGCATSPGVVQVGPDTYLLKKEDHAGIFGNAEAMRLEVIGQANAFAESHSKIVNPISAKSHAIGILGDWASFEFQFQLISKNDSVTLRTHLVPGSDVVADDSGKVVDTFTKKQIEKPTDQYDQLIKLDDLRKKGIISDVEFDVQKKKILSSTP